MKVKIDNLKVTSFDDIAEFTFGTQDLFLVDIISDGRFVNQSNISSPPGAFVYRLDLALDAHKLKFSNIESFSLEIFTEDPYISFGDNPDNSIDQLDKSENLIDQLNAKIKSEYSAVINFQDDLRYAAKSAYLENHSPGSLPEQHIILNSPPKLTGVKKALMLKHNINVPAKASTAHKDLEEEIKKTIMDGVNPTELFNADSDLSPVASTKFSKSSSASELENEYVVTISQENILGRVSLAHQRKVLSSVEASSPDPAVVSLNYLAAGSSLTKTFGFGVTGHVVASYNKKFRVVRNLEIPKRIIGSTKKFYVRLVPIVKDSAEKQFNEVPSPTKFSVSHADKLTEILRPVVEPTVEVIQRTATLNKLRIKNPDPTATRAVLIRRVFDPRKGKTSDKKNWDIPYTPGSAEVILNDTDVDNYDPNRILYDVVCYSNSNRAGPNSGIVLKGVPNGNINAKDQENTTTLISHNTIEGVQILIDNIPSKITHVRLAREDLSKLGDFNDRVSFVSDRSGNSIFYVLRNKSLKIVDSDVYEDRTYRYFCVMRPRLGLDYYSEDDELIRRRFPTQKLPVDVNVTEPVASRGSSGPLVQFDIKATMRDDGLEFIIRLLKRSGVDNLFLDEIKKQRSQLSEAVAFLVERVDKTTGRRESFGLRGAGTFTDGLDAPSPMAEVTPLQDGRKYVYFVKVCLNPVESFFKNLFSSITSKRQTTGTEVTKFMSKKFLDSYLKRFGVLPSDADIRSDSNPRQMLIRGETGLTFVVNIKTSIILPLPSNLKFSGIPSSNFVQAGMLSWPINGPRYRAIKSMVYCNYAGENRLLGSVPIDGQTKNYYFYDKKFAKEVGVKTYTIKILYDNFTQSEPTKEKHVIKMGSIPAVLIGKMVGVS